MKPGCSNKAFCYVIALTASVDSVCGSSDLITEISCLGLCASYDGLQRYKQYVVAAKRSNTSSDCHTSSESLSGSQLMQYVADSVDHDIRTIDGQRTFHGMGIISITMSSA